MAEGWLRELSLGRITALSAGTNPQGLNPGAIQAMREVGIDITGQTSDSIEALLQEDAPDLVISVCDNAREACPTLPSATRNEHWPFEDPADARGSEEEVARVFARVRDEIRARIERWLAEESLETASGE